MKVRSRSSYYATELDTRSQPPSFEICPVKRGQSQNMDDMDETPKT